MSKPSDPCEHCGHEDLLRLKFPTNPDFGVIAVWCQNCGSLRTRDGATTVPAGVSALEELARRGWEISIDLAADQPNAPTVCVNAKRRYPGGVRRRVFGRDKDFNAAVAIAVGRCEQSERSEQRASSRKRGGS